MIIWALICLKMFELLLNLHVGFGLGTFCGLAPTHVVLLFKLLIFNEQICSDNARLVHRCTVFHSAE